MSMFESKEVRTALQDIDRAGARLSKEDWIELCEEVSAYYDGSAEVAREELREEEEGW